MIEAVQITGPIAAFLAGLITSLHCVGMCGPLACTICMKSGGKGSYQAVAIYQVTRIISYMIVGVGAGLIGRRLSDALLGGATVWMTWIFVVFFLAVAVGLDKRLRIPAPKGLGDFLGAASVRFGVRGRAGILGIFTPMLPCAPLYLVVVAAALSGSAWAGAGIMAAFALGTVPLLALLQTQFFRFGSKLRPSVLDYARRGLALGCVILLLVRGTYTATSGCPMCH